MTYENPAGYLPAPMPHNVPIQGLSPDQLKLILESILDKAVGNRGSAMMPMPGSSSAPRFTGDNLREFLIDYEDACRLAGLGEKEKVANITVYIDKDDRYLIEPLVRTAQAEGMTFAETIQYIRKKRDWFSDSGENPIAQIRALRNYEQSLKDPKELNEAHQLMLKLMAMARKQKRDPLSDNELVDISCGMVRAKTLTKIADSHGVEVRNLPNRLTFDEFWDTIRRLEKEKKDAQRFKATLDHPDQDNSSFRKPAKPPSTTFMQRTQVKDSELDDLAVQFQALIVEHETGTRESRSRTLTAIQELLRTSSQENLVAMKVGGGSGLVAYMSAIRIIESAVEPDPPVAILSRTPDQFNGTACAMGSGQYGQGSYQQGGHQQTGYQQAQRQYNGYQQPWASRSGQQRQQYPRPEDEDRLANQRQYRELYPPPPAQGSYAYCGGFHHPKDCVLQRADFEIRLVKFAIPYYYVGGGDDWEVVPPQPIVEGRNRGHPDRHSILEWVIMTGRPLASQAQGELEGRTLNPTAPFVFSNIYQKTRNAPQTPQAGSAAHGQVNLIGQYPGGLLNFRNGSYEDITDKIQGRVFPVSTRQDREVRFQETDPLPTPEPVYEEIRATDTAGSHEGPSPEDAKRIQGSITATREKLIKQFQQQEYKVPRDYLIAMDPELLKVEQEHVSGMDPERRQLPTVHLKVPRPQHDNAQPSKRRRVNVATEAPTRPDQANVGAAFSLGPLVTRHKELTVKELGDLSVFSAVTTQQWTLPIGLTRTESFKIPRTRIFAVIDSGAQFNIVSENVVKVFNLSHRVCKSSLKMQSATPGEPRGSIGYLLEYLWVDKYPQPILLQVMAAKDCAPDMLLGGPFFAQTRMTFNYVEDWAHADFVFGGSRIIVPIGYVGPFGKETLKDVYPDFILERTRMLQADQGNYESESDD
ncbi:hypothetical protein ACHAQA_009855 [Verticillium albo-atrum]